MARMLTSLFRGRRDARPTASLADVLDGYSLEVMPRTAAKLIDPGPPPPPGTRVYVTHIAGTPIERMVATASGLVEAGFRAMPHVPARFVRDRRTLEDWLSRYADAGVTEALLIAGGSAVPVGDFSDSMQLMETGLFDRLGFRRLHVAGHPEGNRDIAPDGSDAALMRALRWKRAFAERTDAEMAIVTQFVFELGPVLDWAARLRQEGIDLPIHLGLAGPARPQTLLKFALACGVGPSVRVLRRRAADVTRLATPHEPTDLLHALAAHARREPGSAIERVHFFPLGGVRATVDFAAAHGARRTNAP